MKKVSLIICIYNFTTVLKNLRHLIDVSLNLYTDCKTLTLITLSF